MPGRQYFNLGDGALINGVTPLHPRAVSLAQPELSKKETVKALIEKCDKFTVQQFEEQWEIAAVIDRLPEFCETLKEITKIADWIKILGSYPMID